MRVGADAYRTKTEHELSILSQFDCDIVQRNRGIDAILKKYYNGHPVAIRIERAGETFADALRLLVTAGRKKQCSYMILITDEDYERSKVMLPHNVIVLNTLSSKFESIVSEMNEDLQSASAAR